MEEVLGEKKKLAQIVIGKLRRLTFELAAWSLLREEKALLTPRGRLGFQRAHHNLLKHYSVWQSLMTIWWICGSLRHPKSHLVVDET